MTERGRLGLRSWLAVVAGKVVIAVSRRLGRGGSTFPGRVARRIDPGILERLAHRHALGNIMITGTNGKTTTTRMLAGALDLSGYRLAHNRAGANLIAGITSAYVEAAPVWGRGRCDAGLAEVDEATVPRAVGELSPRLALVTNFFRDQLDRYGELQHTVALVRRGLASMEEGSGLVLNADDPLVASLGDGLQRDFVFYGLELGGAGPLRDEGEEGRAADARHCVNCGHQYEYPVTYYAHLGVYRCPNCGRGRPRPDVAALDAEIDGDGTRLRIVTPVGEISVRLPVPGVYNIYNAVAAAAAGYALGLSLPSITQGLETFAGSFGRMEVIPVGGRDLAIALVKNPAGFNQVLRTVLEDRTRDKRLLIAINDLHADGTDISWLWDVDFERLVGRAEEFAFIRTTGTRGEEMALRLKYADFPMDRVATGNDLTRDIREAVEATPTGSRLWLLPTYTALLEARRTLHRRGYARPFWEV